MGVCYKLPLHLTNNLVVATEPGIRNLCGRLWTGCLSSHPRSGLGFAFFPPRDRAPLAKKNAMPQSNTAPRNANENARTARQPVDKFTDGCVQVSIWENEGVKGAFRAATIQLRYKDEKKGWRTGTSYGVTELEHLESAARDFFHMLYN
jgi:hypothetical protein